MKQNTQEIDSIKSNKRFSICTLVTDKEEYSQMLDSFENAGFNSENSEFLYIDNSSSNKYDGYSGVNKFLNKSTGKYIILCHQDILLKFDNIATLNQKIEEMDKVDEDWAILANAGFQDFNNVALRITNPWGEDRKIGDLPSKVHSVDENFILVKNEANLALSNNIGGFHLYGTDLVTIANILGYTAYVIDFHLYHKSGGNANLSFYDNKKRFITKYQEALAPKFIRTPVTPIFLSSSKFLNSLLNRKLGYSLRKRWDKIVEKSR